MSEHHGNEDGMPAAEMRENFGAIICWYSGILWIAMRMRLVPVPRTVPVILLPLPPLVLCFIDCPHSSLSSLHTHKTFVQAEVVTDSILPSCSVVSEVKEHRGEPAVNLIQSALLVWRLADGPSYQVGIGVGRSDVVVFVTVNTGAQIWQKVA